MTEEGTAFEQFNEKKEEREKEKKNIVLSCWLTKKYDASGWFWWLRDINDSLRMNDFYEIWNWRIECMRWVDDERCEWEKYLIHQNNRYREDANAIIGI